MLDTLIDIDANYILGAQIIFATLNGPLESQQKKKYSVRTSLSFMFIDLNSGMFLILLFSFT